MKTIKVSAKTTLQIQCDDEDVERVQLHYWAMDTSRMGRHIVKNHVTTLGRYVLNYNGPLEVDHKDRNPLNFCKENLRIATRQQQMANSKPQGLRDFKGTRLTASKRWNARVKFNGKQVHIGNFDTEEQAARAYDRKAKELFGEFALLNFPESKSQCHT